ncbi:hypothetical protein L3X38_011131 [Prunus dulcis]|uniref:Uncharacterized protein n=1 Tax=Prunus dulcis TaxID=3755 RepID=A0AAD4ZER2_PRUDU|nr:hypothetical protein L3X38_011131 [Prunus dulcis]
MALVAKRVNWHGGNTLTHFAKTDTPIYTMRLLIVPNKHIILLAMMANIISKWNLTLVENTQEDETQKVGNIEDGNIFQPKATIIGWNDLQSSEREGRSTTQGTIMVDMSIGEKLDIMRPQLLMVKFIEPQSKTKIGQPSGLGGHEG